MASLPRKSAWSGLRQIAHNARHCVNSTSLFGRLKGCNSGNSLIEFALVLPVLTTMGMYGTEIAYMASVNMEVSQMAMSIADNSSRLGQTDNSGVTPTITEAGVNSILNGAVLEGADFNFAANGRIVLSSLELNPANNRQYIHWQRCKGSLAKTSEYGPTGTGLTGTTFQGMGKPGKVVTAGATTAVMFAEVTFQYQGLFGTMFTNNTTFHHEAAFLVRDDRNLTPGLTGATVLAPC